MHAMQMGLGKTAQSISTLEFQRQLCDIPGPFLIVAPLTTLGHWQREVETWTSMVSHQSPVFYCFYITLLFSFICYLSLENIIYP